ncbi:hypothetical protein CC80DRAFT_589315 [Byssothecium circinans]|uniref:F-box domain-containing protein n=1 Tax=Byssothecium circinans TaxID=147558 RepID=A0A6A5UAA5_9PLEO|nr:hypothetical protein CC80DRAFT_589315 [Byssothecium circinans]
MSRLLSIPRELRDEILLLVVEGRRLTPTSVFEVKKQQRESLHDFSEYEWHSGSSFYLTDSAAYSLNAPPLFLCNKQIQAETRAIIHRRGLNYELEIKVLNDRYFAPTWVSIPALAEKVNRVSVVFQSTGAFEYRPSGCPFLPEGKGTHDIWQRGCGGPCMWVWMLYGLLQRFLYHGPVGARSETSRPRAIAIDNLELDFVDPEDLEALLPELLTDEEKAKAFNLHEYNGYDRRLLPGADGLLRPESFEESVRHEIVSLLAVSYHTAEYGAILYERLGTLSFKVNGKLVAQIDLGKELAERKFNDNFQNVERSQRPQHWNDWKNGMLKKRKYHGLTTVEYEDGWKEETFAIAKKIY